MIKQRGPWSQVIIKGDPLKQKGWVYAEYLKRISSKGGPVLAPSVTTEKSEAPLLPEQTKGIETPPIAETIKEPVDSEVVEEETKEQVFLAGGEGEEADSPLVTKEEVKTAEAATDLEGEEKTETEAPPKAPLVPKGPALVEKEKKKQTVEKAETKKPSLLDKGAWSDLSVKSWERLAAIIALVISFLAFFFSYRAYKVVQECYQAMIRFQERWQKFQDRDKVEKKEGAREEEEGEGEGA